MIKSSSLVPERVVARRADEVPEYVGHRDGDRPTATVERLIEDGYEHVIDIVAVGVLRGLEVWGGLEGSVPTALMLNKLASAPDRE